MTMTADLRVGRLALLDWPDGTPVPGLDGLHHGLGSDRSVLVVRSVAVAGSPDEIGAVISYLESLEN